MTQKQLSDKRGRKELKRRALKRIGPKALGQRFMQKAHAQSVARDIPGVTLTSDLKKQLGMS